MQPGQTVYAVSYVELTANLPHTHVYEATFVSLDDAAGVVVRHRDGRIDSFAASQVFTDKPSANRHLASLVRGSLERVVSQFQDRINALESAA
jgi:hypothetical protein